MGEDTSYMLSCAFRFFVVAASSHGVAIYTQNQILERKRSLCWIIFYYAGKILFINMFLGIIMQEFYHEFYIEHAWIKTLYIVCVVTAAWMTFVVYAWTFHGKLTNIMVSSWVAELIATFTSFFGLGMINILEGRAVFEEIVEFQLMDFGIPVICAVFIVTAGYFGDTFLRKIGSHEYQHKKILWTVFILYILWGTSALFGAASDMSHAAGGMTLAACMSALAVAFWIARGYRRNIRREREYMELQQELLTTHFGKIQEQIQQMEKYRGEVSGKMKAITEIFGDGSKSGSIHGENVRQEQVSAYLETLTLEYRKLKAGTYCNDWMLDAVLSGQAEILEQYGIDFECSAQEYGGTGKGQQELISLILFLIRWGIQANKETDSKNCKRSSQKEDTGWRKFISLHISEVKGQQLIEFRSSWNEHEPLDRNMVEKGIRKYSRSTVDVQKEKNCVHITVILQEG